MAGRIRCPHCGALLPQGTQVCRNCMKPLRQTDSNPYRTGRVSGGRNRSQAGAYGNDRSRSQAGAYENGRGRSETGAAAPGQNYPEPGSYSGGAVPMAGQTERPGRGYRDLDSARMEENGLGSDWHQSWDREDTPDPDRMTAGQWILVVLLLASLFFLVFLGIYWFFLR